MEFRYLLVQQENQICRVTLNRPERLNALNVRIGVELLQALEDCDRSPDVRVVILTGAGRAFCAGDDLRGMSDPGEPDRRYLDPIKQYVEGEGRWPLIVARMRAMSKPVIAMINGHAHGAGFNLALGCDLRVMAETATLAIPFAKRGIATGTNLLQHRQSDGMGAARPCALGGRGRALGIGEPGRSARPARTGDVGDRTRVGRGADAGAWLHEVGCRARMADAAGNRVPASGTGGLSFAAN